MRKDGKPDGWIAKVRAYYLPGQSIVSVGNLTIRLSNRRSD
jgi:hypothetical protein